MVGLDLHVGVYQDYCRSEGSFRPLTGELVGLDSEQSDGSERAGGKFPSPDGGIGRVGLLARLGWRRK
ncbi:conserved protein of unknown function [Limnospira indica PCC 8005]|uniref:Uncharacterized protein n=1 Tax=Limnospira indica PCC 8005 TaxID=376219 RepID=A0A9P1P1F8_9CYAN|nr:conserved protein of unknown function [Limnospira indica PCC 8005]